MGWPAAGKAHIQEHQQSCCTVEQCKGVHRRAVHRPSGRWVKPEPEPRLEGAVPSKLENKGRRKKRQECKPQMNRPDEHRISSSLLDPCSSVAICFGPSVENEWPRQYLRPSVMKSRRRSPGPNSALYSSEKPASPRQLAAGVRALPWESTAVSPVAFSSARSMTSSGERPTPRANAASSNSCP